jgi:hypothetical protein
VTIPSSTADLAPTTPTAEPEQLPFPLEWFLEHASAPLRYRALTEVVRAADVSGLPDISWLPYSHRPAIRLAVTQNRDGMWNQSVLALPAKHGPDFAGIGTIPAVRRLTEYGWDRESPPLVLARRILFRLLAEDNDPAFTFELATKTRDDDIVRRSRGMFREAAAATLAQMGYESDPRLRGAARRILERTVTYLNSPLGEKPWIRVGNTHVLAPESAPPSIYTLTMLAYMPIFRHEHFTMARLNFLRRNEGWMKLFDRFVDDRDRNGVWHPHKGMDRPTTTNAWAWPTFPLDDGSGAESKWTDVTFRIGLIGKLLGREIELN